MVTCNPFKVIRLAIACLALAWLGFVLISKPASTFAAANNTINFQARLENSNGAIVADGTYNVEFKIYSTSSCSSWVDSSRLCNDSGSGQAEWQEDYLVGTNGITVQNGYLTVNLNSVNNNWNSINWGVPQYLTMDIGGTASGVVASSTSNSSTWTGWDGEMSPRLLITGVPYAFVAGELESSSNGSILQWGTSTQETITLPETSVSSPNVCYQTDTNCGFAPTIGGEGNNSYIQNYNVSGSPQSASLDITGTGTFSGSGTGLSVSNNASVGGTLTVSTLGSSTTNYLCTASSSGGELTTCSAGSGAAYIEGGNSFSGLSGAAILGTNNANDLDIVTDGAGRLYLDQNNDAYFGNTAGSNGEASSSVTPSNFNIEGTGSGSTSHPGANLSIYGGYGYTGSTGSAGGTLTLQGGNAGGSGNNNGGSLYIQGGASSGSTGSVGNIYIGTNQAGTSSANNIIQVGYNGGSSAYQTIDLGYGGSSTVDTVNIGNNNSSSSSTILGSTINIGTSSASTIYIGDTNSSTAVDIDGDSSSGILIGDSSGAHTIDIGAGGTSNSENVTIGSPTTTTASYVLLQAANSGSSSGTTGVIIGSATASNNQVNLQLDTSNGSSGSSGADQGTCGLTTNQGAMYYNQATTSDTSAGTANTNEIRACVDGSWQDVITSQMMGLQLFGVVVDSGPAPGDWVGVNSTESSAGPCKVYEGSTSTKYSYTGCTAYSGGRKVIIPADTNISLPTQSGLTNGTTYWIHICLTGTNGLPAASAIGSESADQPTFSASAPVLCLADIDGSYSSSTNTFSSITDIYDTRTFSTTTKEIVSDSASSSLGMIVLQSSTSGIVTPSTSSGQGAIRGVVVATSGSAASPSGSMNNIIATAGPGYVLAGASDTVGNDLETSSTTGYTTSTSNFPEPTNGYGSLGFALSQYNSCSTFSNLCGSIAVNVDIK